MKVLLFLFLIFAVNNDKAREANKAYADGDFDRAIELYNEVLTETPNDTKVVFNLANALAKAGRPQDAAMMFDKYKSMAQSSGETALGDYSLGRTFADMNDWGKAAEHFKRALINDPNDEDARYNYELAVKKKQEQEQEQQQQDQDQQQNKDDQDQQQQQQQNQDQQDQEKQEQQQQQQNQDQQEQPEKPEQNPQEQPKPDQIDKQQAEKILEALENKEEDLLKELKKKKANSKKTNRNDW